MKTNHVPVSIRIENKIKKLSYRLDEVFIKSPEKNNPYYCCSNCGIYQPEISIRNGRHFKNCRFQGLEKEIEYYKKLLAENEVEIIKKNKIV